VATSRGIRGFGGVLMTRPQYPIAHVASVWVTVVNAFTVLGKKNEWHREGASVDLDQGVR